MTFKVAIMPYEWNNHITDGRAAQSSPVNFATVTDRKNFKIVGLKINVEPNKLQSRRRF